MDNNHGYVLKAKHVLRVLLTINTASKRIFGTMSKKFDVDEIGNNEYYSH